MPRHQSDIDRFHCLRDYHARHQTLPSYQKIAELLGYASSSAASAAMKRLMKMGYVKRADGGRLSPGPRFFELPMAVTRVPAGLPVDDEDLGFTLGQIDHQLVRNPSRTYILKVEGDSMIEAGILDGDFVVVERDTHCKVGDIVVAVVDGRRTVKFLAERNDKAFLRPGNSRYPDIVPADRLEIDGLVTGTFRKIEY